MARRKAFAAKPQRIRELLETRKQMRSRWRSVKRTAKSSGLCAGEFSNSLRATGLTKLNEDVVVPRSHLVDLMEFAEKLQTKHGFPIACFGHAGDGNIHVNIMADRYNRDATVREKVDQRAGRSLRTSPGLGWRDYRRTRNRSCKKTLVAGRDQRGRARVASSTQTNSRSKRNFKSGKIC